MLQTFTVTVFEKQYTTVDGKKVLTGDVVVSEERRNGTNKSTIKACALLFHARTQNIDLPMADWDALQSVLADMESRFTVVVAGPRRPEIEVGNCN